MIRFLLSRVRFGLAIMAVAASTGLAGCAAQEPGEPWDPLEVPNRFIFAINRTIDMFVVRPIAVTYKFWVPEPIQRGVTNVVQNLGEPVTAINEVAQGEPSRAAQTVARFLVNSTIGILGIFDVAKNSESRRPRRISARPSPSGPRRRPRMAGLPSCCP